jgi:transcriptional regulator GlxA family with amidase domain
VERVLAQHPAGTSAWVEGANGPRFFDYVQALPANLRAHLQRLEVACEGGDEEQLQRLTDQLLWRMVLLNEAAASASEQVFARRAKTRQSIFRRLHRARDHVRAVPGERLSVAELADLAQRSRYHFQRKFHELFRVSVADFQRLTRLQTARVLLLESRQTLADIALQVGYEHHSSLSRAFNRQFGYSPDQLRTRSRALN